MPLQFAFVSLLLLLVLPLVVSVRANDAPSDALASAAELIKSDGNGLGDTAARCSVLMQGIWHNEARRGHLVFLLVLAALISTVVVLATITAVVAVPIVAHRLVKKRGACSHGEPDVYIELVVESNNIEEEEEEESPPPMMLADDRTRDTVIGSWGVNKKKKMECYRSYLSVLTTL